MREQEKEIIAPSTTIALPPAWGKKQGIELRDEYDHINRALTSLQEENQRSASLPKTPSLFIGNEKRYIPIPEFIPVQQPIRERVSSRIDSLERKRLLNRRLEQIEGGLVRLSEPQTEKMSGNKKTVPLREKPILSKLILKSRKPFLQRLFSSSRPSKETEQKQDSSARPELSIKSAHSSVQNLSLKKRLSQIDAELERLNKESSGKEQQ